MVFSSLLFIFIYLVVTLALYYTVPNRVYRNVILCVLSLIFYGWGEPSFVLLMIFSIAFNWLAGLLVGKYRNNKKRCKAVLVASVVLNLALLGVFKYTGFVVDTLKAVFPFMRSYATPIIPLPIGISFYTFQAMSYVIDVYRNDTSVQKNPVYFGTYVALFPQLIAGPIVRYRDIADQLENRHENVAQFASGIKLFTVGLAKKVLLANVLYELITVFQKSRDLSVLFYWLYAVSFTLQLYFDFSGYSDMAIGLGRIFGFRFSENFNYPYISGSITEFWRRWHISLGSWFRDYVYIPLGGNRVSKAKWLRNILVVWMLTGLWHGASWNFVLWGLGFAVLLVAEKLVYGRLLQRTHVLKHVYTLLLVTLSFVLFNADSVSEAVSQLGAMFGAGGLPLVSTEGVYYLKSYAGTFLFAAIGATPLVSNAISRFGKTRFGAQALTVLQPLVMLALLAACTAFLVDGSFNPFLYFRF